MPHIKCCEYPFTVSKIFSLSTHNLYTKCIRCFFDAGLRMSLSCAFNLVPCVHWVLRHYQKEFLFIFYLKTDKERNKNRQQIWLILISKDISLIAKILPQAIFICSKLSTRTMHEIYSKLAIKMSDIVDVVLVSLLLTLKRFYRSV